MSVESLQGKDRWIFVKQKQKYDGLTYDQIGPKYLGITGPSLRTWMSKNSKKYGHVEIPNVNHIVNQKINSTSSSHPSSINNHEDILDQPREVRLRMIQEGLFLLSEGNLQPNEYAAVSRELRFWREHEEKYGSLEEEEKTIKLDPIDKEYILNHVEEVFCEHCPYRKHVLKRSVDNKEKARLLPADAARLG